MSDLICRKSMMRCQTPGMCTPHGGCTSDSDKAAIGLTNELERFRALITDYQQGAKAEADAADEARREIKRLEQELKTRTRFAEYWKQRAKSAEGHLFASDSWAAFRALHKISNFSEIPEAELTVAQHARIGQAVHAVIVTINARRAVRRPPDKDEASA